MDGELGDLATSAATTIVTLLATDSWGQVKQKIGALWRRFRPEQANDIETDVVTGHLEIQNGSEMTAVAITKDWESRLLRLLAADTSVAAELGDVLAELRQIQTGSQERTSIQQSAKASDHSTVIMGGRDVTIGRLHLPKDA